MQHTNDIKLSLELVNPSCKKMGVYFSLGIAPIRDVNHASVDRGRQLLNVNYTTKLYYEIRNMTKAAWKMGERRSQGTGGLGFGENGGEGDKGLERRKIDEETTRRGAAERRMLETTPETNSRV